MQCEFSGSIEYARKYLTDWNSISSRPWVGKKDKLSW